MACGGVVPGPTCGIFLKGSDEALEFELSSAVLSEVAFTSGLPRDSERSSDPLPWTTVLVASMPPSGNSDNLHKDVVQETFPSRTTLIDEMSGNLTGYSSF